MEEMRLLLEKGEPGKPVSGLIWYEDANAMFRVRIQTRTVLSDWHDVDVVILESND